MSSRNPIIPVLLGQTASGKTSAGIELAKLLDGEVISVDSRKVYRYLPIGTATPPGDWRGKAYQVKGVDHHLMGHLDPGSFYTAGDFAKDAASLIEEILKRGKRPILVGGTGFYFKALKNGLPSLPNRDPKIRENLDRLAKEKGPEALHALLIEKDPEAAAAISSQDRHKIIRALEVIQMTGKPYSAAKGKGQPSPHRFQVFALQYEKDFLRQKIEVRSRWMAENGMMAETRALLDKGYSPTCPALSSFGYREAVQVVQGQRSEESFLPELIKGTVQYAKRQATWLRTQVTPEWIPVTPQDEAKEIALKMSAFLQNS